MIRFSNRVLTAWALHCDGCRKLIQQGEAFHFVQDGILKGKRVCEACKQELEATK